MMVVLPRRGMLLTGEVGLVMLMIMLKALRPTVWCFCLLGAGLDASRAAGAQKFGLSANSVLL